MKESKKQKKRKIEDLEKQLINLDDDFPQLEQRTRLTRTPNNQTRQTQLTQPNTNDENVNYFISLHNVLNEINQLCNIKQFLNKAKAVLTKLKGALNQQDKIAAMFELMADD